MLANYKRLKDKETILFGGMAIALTVLLFYIDEGAFSWAWVKSLGAWIVFFMYTLVFFAAQLLMYGGLSYWVGRKNLLWGSVVSGVIIGGLALVFVVFA